MNFTAIVAAQRDYFNTGVTRGVAIRRLMLDKLERAIIAHEKELLDALKQDLGKHSFEAYACELGIVLGELRHAKKHLAQWAEPKSKPTPLAMFPAKSKVIADPYGVTLIMSPWNYPVQLTLVPLIAALAAGNCAVVKPSAYASASSAAVAKVLEEVFDPRYVAVVQGGRAENAALLEQHFDYIFFTGSPEVGKTVMTAAAAHLTPVTLELGGKSPTIICDDANLPLAARRIAWGKFLNGGQTCVAPDHVWVPEHLRERLVEELGKQIKLLYGADPLDSPDLPKIINEKHFQRICALMKCGKTAIGGTVMPDAHKITPTVLVDITEEDAVMGEEIFGPVLPILTYTDLGALVQKLQQKPRPLALYVFSASRGEQSAIINALPSGGVCVNDTVIHLANPNVPFGGVGNSGMGCCHGKFGFDTFTHHRTVVYRGKRDLPVRYAPYQGKSIGLLKKLM